MILKDIVVIVIGRNEGLRLQRCLISLKQAYPDIPVVYVDSGSTDDSVAFARALGIPVVILDESRAYTAARARNAGFEFVRARFGKAKYVQFLDGDCELQSTWLAQALETMEHMPRIAALRGYIQERSPKDSIYNRLCAMEWDAGPAGELEFCGGIMLMRVDAFAQVGGFDEHLIAGEEPELCLRLRSHAWKIWLIGEPMAVHDAHMTHFGQWWRRAQRTGFAIAQGLWLHGGSPERYCVRESVSALFWGLFLPAVFAVCVMTVSSLALPCLALYLLQGMRIALRQGGLYAVFCMLSKTAEAWGYLRFFGNKLVNQPVQLIEYK